MTRFADLRRGDPAPWFKQRSASRPSYAFDTAAGRYILLLFFDAQDGATQAAIAELAAAGALFDDKQASFFGVAASPGDEAQLCESYPGYRYFLDFDKSVSRLYGAAALEGDQTRRLWILLDPQLRVLDAIAFEQISAKDLIARIAALPAPGAHAGYDAAAPVLHLPNVLEPALCEALLDYYRRNGGEESGFMRERDGRTVLVHDHVHKRRRDCIVTDAPLIEELQARVRRRISPEIAKAHQFRVTRMERYLIGCYAADDGGHFRAHRDNTTAGTAHRRFAVSINLNAAFDGGEISFPEYGPRAYKPPPGAAVVFSCSLLHQVSKVTRGERYAFLPFLYDDAAAALRERNRHLLSLDPQNP